MLLRTTTALCLLTILSCAPKPVVVEPLAPVVARLAEQTRATASTATKVSTGVKDAQKRSSDLQVDIVKGMLEAERVRKAGLATQGDLDANADAWQAVHARNLFLEAAMKPLVVDAKELEEATKRTAADTTDLAVKALEHDKSVASLKTELVKQADDAAIGKWIKRSLWMIAIVAGLYFLAKLILPLIKPL